MNNTTLETRRFALLVGATVLLAGLLVGGMLLFSKNSNDVKEPNQNVTISKEDKDSIRTVSSSFFKADGKWGLRADRINPDNLEFVVYNVATRSSTSDSYWSDRNKSYSITRDQYIAPDSPMFMSDSTANARIDDSFERDKMMDFSVKNVDTAMDRDKGSKIIRPDGTQVETYTSQVTVTSQVGMRALAADDSSSDGTMNVMQRTYTNSPLVTFAKVDGKWKVWEVQGLRHPFVMASWKEPSDYMESLSDFEQVGTLKGTKK